MSAITPVVTFNVGQTVRAMFLRHDEESGQSVLQSPDNVVAYMSFYDMSDDTFETIVPGTYLYVVVVRIDKERGVPYAVVEELRYDAIAGDTTAASDPPYESHRLNQHEEEEQGRTVYRRQSAL
jgi:hypothetical protein